MTNAQRIRAYARTNHQNGKFRPTPAQRRRISKNAHKENKGS
jgi:hypothetical protein